MMKSTIRACLCLLLLCALLFSAVSCETAVTHYGDLRDHLIDTAGYDTAVDMPQDDETLRAFTFVQSAKDDAKEAVYVSTEADSGTYVYRLDIRLSENPGSAVTIIYRIIGKTTGEEAIRGELSVNPDRYTGNELLAFDEVSGIITNGEYNHRVYATSLANAALAGLDRYAKTTLNLDAADFGFTSLADRYLYVEENADDTADTDLGGAFSAARVSYALRMTLLGMVMIFAVLALLWLVIAVFRSLVGGKEPRAPKAPKPPKEPKATPAVQNTPVVAAVPASMGDDPAVIAAITAAISAMINADPALRSQFPSGFRVVSFRKTTDKTTGKTAWNR